MDIRLDIRQGNLVFSQILDIKKAQIIQLDIQLAGYQVHP
jgi:hypothetical protein